MNGAEALVQSMINQGIQYCFGIPGAKVDLLFETLQYHKDPRAPELIVTRHEQNAIFMAAAIGRLTGKPGVALVTSGPGVTNLTTGLLTATSEGDPLIALGGQVPQDDLNRATHQAVNSANLLKEVTKSSVEVEDANNVSEVFTNAYQTAISPKQGATFISLPQNVLAQEVNRPVLNPLTEVDYGQPSPSILNNITEKIKAAKAPVILAGMRASSPENTAALRALIDQFALPVVETFQGAGAVSKTQLNKFFGRIGLFKNQLGDSVLRDSDLILTVGYDPVEYEPRNWNNDATPIICIDEVQAELSNDFQPKLKIQSSIAETLIAIKESLPTKPDFDTSRQAELDDLRAKYAAIDDDNYRDYLAKPAEQDKLNPLQILETLQNKVNDDTTVTVDIGSHYIWMARYFESYNPRTLLFSNGMQTLGVALPWAISASLIRPEQKIVSIAGDGGFLFSGQDLETAVRLKSNIVQLIWNDSHYDMVRFQEIAKYGKDSGVDFNNINYAKIADGYGATGIRVNSLMEFKDALDRAFEIDGPVVIDIPVDYSNNIKLKTSKLL
ncbi:acetolactate synthase AlsS [Convivina intestini]|uniref:Acetolactate synthase large subunit n=1 Tax=Convivina intestini TaxID=1505726 RepID=A0A2U1DFA6_9LACO|nr:acetolactate synthase AlsS [Convivina intestini]PVY86348.1 acetolactate synthase large subunit [Convivina intestini]CAH1850728.1 Acetolactate synthase [Convivina intestini]SDB82763.1 acetolactate synthase, large subunit [Leuconostocaceae bacterium R-53105]